ncbi:NADH-quinone oxidoreductase subunit NuoN [Altererythrobacter sp. KTW20L]|uniref:NADH-quinone oxidoreductase subunit NuoN n=1 Tax=Altererythrobacter sp. KTW20L TaxID=2942210 RepID=UPI0020C025C8|nr:NADH-quinone oxidoreductase subunit NuoN [Altererythrobacter sp. KTW20L]MCL6251921.1 NADH-quinone oxidoreductase subunit NuoN [Altererythrobacter sp. KTW20L]
MELTTSLGLIVPELVLAVSGLIMLLFAAWGGNEASKPVSIACCVALGGAFALVAPSVCGGYSGPGTLAFYGQLRIDAFAGFAKLMIYASAGAALVVAPRYFDRLNAMKPEFAVLVIFSALGMSIMVSAADLISLYIGLELTSLASYVLASFLRDDDKSAEAGLKYFVLGALASGILLFGSSLIYGFTGSTSFAGISAGMAGGLSGGMLFGLIFVMAGLAFKISAVPFHMWTPDVYEGAPTPVTMFFASAPKVAAVALLARVSLEAFGSQPDAWQQIVTFAAIASIVVGALGAIGQENLKRLLAFSSINNVGFILIGLATATVAGASSMLLYLVFYVAMTVGSFVALLMLTDAEGKPLETFADIKGLSTTRPALAWCLLLIMFSLAGIPPLMGFYGKLVVFQAAVEADLIALAAIGIAASVIGAFYYLKFIKVMFFDEAVDRVQGKADKAQWALLALATLAISPFAWLLTGWLASLADGAAAALFFAA